MPDRRIESHRKNDERPVSRARLIGRVLIMRLYGAIQKVEPQDDGTVRVHGIASSEVVDDQGEIVRADAMRTAVPDYMRFPALREMHQLSAAGTTLEAEVGDDGATRIVAHVVDPVAVSKVKNQVYRGFSIGGRVTQREAGNPKVITALVLNEISLVDRPANPEAVFDCWKAATAADAPRAEADMSLAAAMSTTQAREPFNPPIQIWACGVPDHHHRAKGDAVRCLETRTAEAADLCSPQTASALFEASMRAEPEAAGPGKTGGAIDAARTAIETAEGAVVKSDASETSSTSSSPSELHSYLDELVSEETEAIMDNPQMEAGSRPLDAPEVLAIAADPRGAARFPALLKTGNPKMQKLAAGRLAKAKHSQADQALADMAYYACDKCMKIDGLPVAEEQHMAWARDHLRKAGAISLDGSTLDAAGNRGDTAGQMRHLPSDFRPGDNATVDTSKRLGPLAAARGKLGRDHQNLIDLAHDCVRKLTDGMACPDLPPSDDLGPTAEEGADTEEAAARRTLQSAEMMDELRAAHDQLVAAGAECDAADSCEKELEGTEFESVKASQTRGLAKVLAGERAEKAALVKALDDIVPLLDRLSKRVDDIARTPLPPLTIARGSVAVSKQEDGGISGSHSEGPLSPEAIASALAKMSKEEQTLTLIRASYANPIPVRGAATGER
jgi:hypothetical protein